MIEPLSDQLRQILREAEKGPLFRDAGLRSCLLDGIAIEALLPHRGPSLLIDSVTEIDLEQRLVVAECDLGRRSDVLDGHFPGHPVWPAVLQVEAVAQAGLIALGQAAPSGSASGPPVLTHILGARFMRPVTPRGGLTVAARVFEDGLFFDVVGQCLSGGRVCSVMALRGVPGGREG